MIDFASSEEPQGGKGELLGDPRHERSDLVLLNRAARGRWPINDRHCRNWVRKLNKIIKDGKPETAVKAIGVGVNMMKQNQADEHKVLPSVIDHRHTLDIEYTRSRLAAIRAQLASAIGGGVADSADAG